MSSVWLRESAKRQKNKELINVTDVKNYPKLQKKHCVELAKMMRLRPGKFRLPTDNELIADRLHLFPVFQTSNREILLDVANCAKLLCGQPGDVIAKEDEKADFFLIVLAGEVVFFLVFNFLKEFL